MSNEKTIQNALHAFRTDCGHSFIAPNATLPSGEADLLSISKSDFVYEHEIKISRADFKADFKHKEEKHVWMQDAKKLKGECVRIIESRKRWGSNLKIGSLHCANYFFYVVPKDLIKLDEVPPYAGLLYWNAPIPGGWFKYGSIDLIKAAPRLHGEKITPHRMEKLAQSMMYRYWNYRLKQETV